MTSKEYLQQIRTLDTIIDQKRQELNNLQEIATSVRSLDYSSDRVQTSPKGEAPYARTAEKAADLDVEIRALEDERLAIIGSIHAIGDERYISVLYKRYVEGKRFDLIAEEVGYVETYVWQLHTEALAEIKQHRQT